MAAQQMAGFGGMLILELDGDATTTAAVEEPLTLFALAPSLGGAESLVTQPITTTHHGLVREDLHWQGISGAMLRLSVVLIADLEQAFGS